MVEGTREVEATTYGEFDRRGRSIAVCLRSQFRLHDRLLLLYPPTVEYVTAFFGCLYAGMVAVPAYPPSPRTVGRLAAVLRDSSPAGVLAPSTIAALVREGLAGAGLDSLPVIETDLIESAPEEWEPPQVDGATIAFIQYTSGSTSAPKGVMVSHANIICNERMIQQAFGLDHSLVCVGWLPLYHDMGLIGNVVQPLFVGGRSYIMSPIEFLKRPVTWLQAITRFRGHTAGGPNFGYERCVRKVTAEERASLDLSSWTVAYNGAEPVRTLERFASTFGACGFRPKAMYPCYGLAEATLFVSGNAQLAGPQIREFEVDALERENRPSSPPVAGAGPSCRPGTRGSTSGSPSPIQAKEPPSPMVGSERSGCPARMSPGGTGTNLASPNGRSGPGRPPGKGRSFGPGTLGSFWTASCS